MIMTSNLHSRAIVVDAVCPLLYEPWHVDRYINGGVTVAAPTVGSTTSTRQALDNVALWHRLCRERDDLLLVRKASDVLCAKEEGKLGIVLHFQGTDPLEDNLDLVDAFHSLSVNIIQLTYNTRNRVGDGCTEPSDAGLSVFGKQLIRKMNDLGMIVDCSHTGHRTTMDAIEESSAPVVLSHANSRAVYPSQRNVPDDLVRAISATGGLVGAVAYSPFVSAKRQASLEDFVAHIDHYVQLVGADHVALGMDYYVGQHPIASMEKANDLYETHIRSGRWSRAIYPPPPYYYPEKIETPDDFANLTHALERKGYSENDVLKIMGGNWLRVYETVWKN